MLCSMLKSMIGFMFSAINICGWSWNIYSKEHKTNHILLLTTTVFFIIYTYVDSNCFFSTGGRGRQNVANVVFHAKIYEWFYVLCYKYM